MNLSNKTAIVTGVSKGIGLSVAKALLNKGVRVAGWSRSEPRLQHENFSFFKTDIGTQQSVDEAFGKSMEFLDNKLHILINNAGLGYFGKMDEIPVEQWKEMFDTNVNGLFFATRKSIPVMKAQQLGHIINIASIAGLSGIEEATGYCATKFAVRGISQSLFKEVRKFNIKVTSICPGSVNTEFFNGVESVKANETMLSTDDIATNIVQILEMPDNFLTVEVELRPLNVRYS